MLKKWLLWVTAAGIAVGFGQFLLFVATGYSLPQMWPLSLTPQVLMALFGFVLIGVGGADIVRYFIRAGIRVRRTEPRAERSSPPAAEPVASTSEEVLAEQFDTASSQVA